MKSLMKLLIISAIAIIPFSCSEDEEQQPEVNEQVVFDVLSASSEINEIEQMVKSSNGTTNGRTNNNVCAEIVWNSETQLTLDFGTGCTSPLGRERKGKVIVEYNEPPTLLGGEKTVRFENYEVNGNAFSGSITTSGLVLGQDKLEYTLSAENFSINYAEDESTTIINQLSYNYTMNTSTYELTVSGSSSGVTRQNIAYQAVIKTPLTYTNTCFSDFIFYPSMGTMDLTINDGVTMNSG